MRDFEWPLNVIQGVLCQHWRQMRPRRQGCRVCVPSNSHVVSKFTAASRGSPCDSTIFCMYSLEQCDSKQKTIMLVRFWTRRELSALARFSAWLRRNREGVDWIFFSFFCFCLISRPLVFRSRWLKQLTEVVVTSYTDLNSFNRRRLKSVKWDELLTTVVAIAYVRIQIWYFYDTVSYRRRMLSLNFIYFKLNAKCPSSLWTIMLTILPVDIICLQSAPAAEHGSLSSAQVEADFAFSPQPDNRTY